MIAAWPSFALIGAYELLMRQVRRSAAGTSKPRAYLPVRIGQGGAVGPRVPHEPLRWAQAATPDRSSDGSGPLAGTCTGQHS